MREQWTRFWTRPNSGGMANLDPIILQKRGANLNAFVADVSFGNVAWAGNHFQNDGA